MKLNEYHIKTRHILLNIFPEFLSFSREKKKVLICDIHNPKYIKFNGRLFPPINCLF